MKKILFTLLAIPLLVGCVQSPKQPLNENTSFIPPKKENVRIEMLSEQVDQGLYRITIDDTTKVLLYRGVESCTMVKLK